jgi:hypothetical protein
MLNLPSFLALLVDTDCLDSQRLDPIGNKERRHQEWNANQHEIPPQPDRSFRHGEALLFSSRFCGCYQPLLWYRARTVPAFLTRIIKTQAIVTSKESDQTEEWMRREKISVTM